MKGSGERETDVCSGGLGQSLTELCVCLEEVLEQADYLYSCAETEKLHQLLLQYKDRWGEPCHTETITNSFLFSHSLHFIFSLEVIGIHPVWVRYIVYLLFLSSPSISDDAEFLWRLARAARDLALQPNIEAERKKQLTFEAFENAKKALEKDETIFAVHKVSLVVSPRGQQWFTSIMFIKKKFLVGFLKAHLWSGCFFSLQGLYDEKQWQPPKDKKKMFCMYLPLPNVSKFINPVRLRAVYFKRALRP